MKIDIPGVPILELREMDNFSMICHVDQLMDAHIVALRHWAKGHARQRNARIIYFSETRRFWTTCSHQLGKTATLAK